METFRSAVGGALVGRRCRAAQTPGKDRIGPAEHRLQKDFIVAASYRKVCESNWD
ncbi:MAG TPA: hypothetical protein VF988_05000 [Verrucomicrobiae bacterium]